MTPTPSKKPSARKSLFIFTKILYVKNKTAIRRVGASKSKLKAVKSVTTPWALKQKRKGNPKINDQIKKSIYSWIMYHPQVVQSPIFNDCLKVNIDGHTELQLVPIFLLQVSVKEIHNRLVSDTDNGGLEESRDVEKNIIISDSTYRSLLPPQF